MVNELKRIVIILTPLVVLAAYIGQSMDSDTAALAMGALLGLLGGGLFALIAVVAREARGMREQEEARRPARRPAAARAEAGVIEGEWQEVVQEQRAPAAVRGQIEAPGRALVVRSANDG